MIWFYLFFKTNFVLICDPIRDPVRDAIGPENLHSHGRQLSKMANKQVTWLRV